MACFEMSKQIEGLSLSVAEAGPLARTLLRVVGRIVIDTGSPGADPETWSNTEEMVLLWIDEAVGRLGYQVVPEPGSGRPGLSSE